MRKYTSRLCSSVHFYWISLLYFKYFVQDCSKMLPYIERLTSFKPYNPLITWQFEKIFHYERTWGKVLIYGSILSTETLKLSSTTCWGLLQKLVCILCEYQQHNWLKLVAVLRKFWRASLSISSCHF